MPNAENLIPMNRQPPEVRKEMGKRGGLAKARNRRNRKAMSEILKGMLDLPIPKSQAKMRTALKRMGVNAEDASNLALVCLQLINLTMSQNSDAKTKLRAIELIHRFTEGDKLDITTNGKDVAHEPLIVQVIDSREQVDKEEEEDRDEDTDNEDIS